MFLNFAAFFIFVSLPLLVALLWVFWRRRGPWFVLFFVPFYFYLQLVLAVTLFPIPIDPERAALMRSQGITLLDRTNLIPLYFGPYFPHSVRSILRALWPNVLLTLPFGAWLPLLARIRLRQVLWLGPLAGLTIETLQVLLSFVAGYPYRVLDINDVIANAFGVWLGTLAFLLFAAIFQALLRLARARPRGLLAYLAQRTQLPR